MLEGQRFTLARARFLLPLAAPDRDRRIADGYLLTDCDTVTEVGAYTTEVGRRLRRSYGSELHVVGTRRRHPLAGERDEAGVPLLRGALLPAFVKAHGHDHEQPIIGIAKDEPLTAWLDHAVNPFTGFVSSRSPELTEALGCSPQRATYRMARLADIHYGITASMVHHCNHNKYHARTLAEVNEAAGTTMIAALGSQDRHYVEELLDLPEDAVRRLDEAAAIEGLKRTSFCPGPDQLFSNGRRMLLPLKRWAGEHGALLHFHSSEEPATTRWFTEEVEPGMTPVEYADFLGILDPSTVLAHQVNNGPRDLEILARSGACVVHNPLANTILGSGMPPIIDMLALGIPVAISTDGSGSADNQNILAAARLAAQYQKALMQDASVLPAIQLLEMITSVPARILGFNLGELAPGRQADWILIDTNRPNLVPTRLDNLVENLIWAADGSEVDTVIARGRPLKWGGEVLPFADGATPDEIMTAVQTLSELFVEHLRTAPELKGTGVHR